MLGESTSPFIDEGDGLTSERERVHLFLSLVAHAGGYKTIVGADIFLYSIVGAVNSHTVRPPTCLWASIVLWAPGFTVQVNMVKLLTCLQASTTFVGTDICHF